MYTNYLDDAQLHAYKLSIGDEKTVKVLTEHEAQFKKEHGIPTDYRNRYEQFKTDRCIKDISDHYTYHIARVPPNSYIYHFDTGKFERDKTPYYVKRIMVYYRWVYREYVKNTYPEFYDEIKENLSLK